ncbi:MAG TPA: alpha/beta hydrolase [Thermoanaerobaculia bacterium]|nr:alpha/beta hydrolase [Thermoanaerobaculia bacterium]
MMFLLESLVVLLLAGYLAKKKGWGPFKGKGFEQRTVSVGGGLMAYLEGSRKGTTVLLLHGFAGDKEQWREVGRLLEKYDYRVIVPDLPGFGANYRDPEAQYDAPSLAKHLRSFVSKAEIGMFHLVGHGIGATIAASYAYAFPIEIASLTLIEPLGITAPSDSELDRMLAKRRNPFLVATTSAYDTLFAFLTAKTPTMSAADKKRRAETLIAGRGFYQQVWAQQMEGERGGLLDMLLPAMDMRMLLVFGARSRVVARMTPEVVGRRMEGKPVQTVVLPDCGHWLMLEKPQELVDVCVPFFRRAKVPGAESARERPAPDTETEGATKGL